MNDGKHKPSFWETLPGIITAAAAFVGACGLFSQVSKAGRVPGARAGSTANNPEGVVHLSSG